MSSLAKLLKAAVFPAEWLTCGFNISAVLDYLSSVLFEKQFLGQEVDNFSRVSVMTPCSGFSPCCIFII